MSAHGRRGLRKTTLVCPDCGETFGPLSAEQCAGVKALHEQTSQHRDELIRKKATLFFLPGAHSVQNANEIYEGIKKFVSETSGRKITARRILSIAYEHDGRQYYAEVGKPDPRLTEVVVAILESDLYLVCTPNRGVLRGMPLLVGENEALSIFDFPSS